MGVGYIYGYWVEIGIFSFCNFSSRNFKACGNMPNVVPKKIWWKKNVLAIYSKFGSIWAQTSSVVGPKQGMMEG